MQCDPHQTHGHPSEVDPRQIVIIEEGCGYGESDHFLWSGNIENDIKVGVGWGWKECGYLDNTCNGEC
jgi:hypothetical protein